MSDRQFFSEVKDRVNLVDFIESHTNTKPDKRGKHFFFNPAPCCSHNDCFVVRGPDFNSYICNSCQDKGDVFNFVQTMQGLEPGPALKYVAEQIGFQFPGRDNSQPKKKQTKAEWIAAKCWDNTDQAIAYLVEERGITKEVAEEAVKAKAVGFNSWTSDTRPAGKPLHGGPAVAFVCKDPITKQVMAVDMRYLDADLNGGVKTQCQGEKDKTFWTPDINKLKSKYTHTVYLVESSINALSIECCKMPGVAAVSILGTGNAINIDLHHFMGKQVILCMDNDEPDKNGDRPGAKTAWLLHERCTALNISALMVDWSKWVFNETEFNDVNDILQAEGVDTLRTLLRNEIEQWIIAGLPGNKDHMKGKGRLFLPGHDFAIYWRYRAKADFTTIVTEKTDKETGDVRTESSDVCGFRVASISKVRIASVTATMTGEEDNQPQELFCAAVQPADQKELIRDVFKRDKLFNVDSWQKLGPIFNRNVFLRMLNILMRASHLGGREAVNFVGLCWMKGKLHVSEGPDTYFPEPEQQCPYHNLVFPSGSPASAARVVNAYQETFTNNAALIPLIWSLGGHLKALLGFWPHMVVQAEKSVGKSTLIKRLERTISMQMFGSENVKTEYRLLKSISSTSHPIGLEEFSTLPQVLIDRAIGMFQQCYNSVPSTRGPKSLEYNLSAPILLAGEDVPVKSLLGKVVMSTLTHEKRGPMLADKLPRFPVRQWLEYLANQDPDQIRDLQRQNISFCIKHCRAGETGGDVGRIIENYAALLTCWANLADFAGVDSRQGDVARDIVAEMNTHIADTSGDRKPWVWIMDLFLNEIASNKYRHPYDISKDEEGTPYIAFLPSHVMHHIRTDNGLRTAWDGLPVKSARGFKEQLKLAGVILNNDISFTSGQRRQTHAIALNAEKLAEFGLHVMEPDVAADLPEAG